MLTLLISSLLATNIDHDWAEMLPPAVSRRQFTPYHFRSLQEGNLQKNSRNFFDLKPICEQLGPRYCDYDSHNLGSGLEFANWRERTQFMYANMARMDPTQFAKAPYNAQYGCTTKSGLVPFYWESAFTQAARSAHAGSDSLIR